MEEQNKKFSNDSTQDRSAGMGKKPLFGTPDDPDPFGIQKNPKPESPENPLLATEGDLFQHSLTPINVLQHIRRGVIAVLGLRPGAGGKFTPLEEKLILYMENIVRRGDCPSVLVRNRDLFEALHCLKRVFGNADVTIPVKGKSGREEATVVLIFPTLCQAAKEAANCEARARKLRVIKTQAKTAEDREKLRREMLFLRGRKDECLYLYQKIIFADSARVQNPPRRLVLRGRAITLDQLIQYLKAGRKTNPPRNAQNVNLPAGATRRPPGVPHAAPNRARPAAVGRSPDMDMSQSFQIDSTFNGPTPRPQAAFSGLPETPLAKPSGRPPIPAAAMPQRVQSPAARGARPGDGFPMESTFKGQAPISARGAANNRSTNKVSANELAAALRKIHSEHAGATAASNSKQTSPFHNRPSAEGDPTRANASSRVGDGEDPGNYEFNL